MKLRSLLSFTMVALVLVPMAAQSLSPSEVASKILEASPATRADALGMASLAESLKTEGNLPDPEIEGEYLFAPGDEKNRWGAGVSWGLEWPGVYKAREQEAKGRLAAAEAAVARTRRERLVEVKRLLLDYVLAQKRLGVLNQIKASNDSIIELSVKAESHGELTRLDLNKLRLEQASLNGNISSALNSRCEAQMQLNALYGGDCSSLLEDMACEFPQIAVPKERAYYLQSPAVMAANAEAEAAKGALKMADAEAYPGLSVGYQHAFEDGMHFNGATLGISIPLFSSRGKKSAAKAAMAEAEYKVEKAAAEAKAAIEGSERRLMIVCKQIDEMEPAVNDPDNTSLLMKALRGGVITLIDYLNERNYFTNATLELLNLRHTAANLLLDIETWQ